MILLTYYGFTTLSTVGLGDFHPVNNPERVLCSLIMLFGVMMTSFLMDNLIQMINKIRFLNKNHEESQMLALFLGTMKRFNGNSPLPEQLVSKLEEFFMYRWQNDPNLAISTDEDKFLLDQIPERIQSLIYTNFLFKDFLETYKDSFRETRLVKYKRAQHKRMLSIVSAF